MSAAIVPHRSTRIVHLDASRLTNSMTSVSDSVRRFAIQSSRLVSNRSKIPASGWKNATPIRRLRKYTTMTIQNLPLRPSWWGSGGASPDGRRWRLTLGPGPWLRGSLAPPKVSSVTPNDRPFVESPTLPQRVGDPALGEPPGGHRGGCFALGDVAVHALQVLGGQGGGDGVRDLHQLGPEPGQDVGPDDRRDVLRRLKVAVVLQQDEAVGIDLSVAREQQGCLHLPGLEGRYGERASLVERHERLEPQAVHGRKPFQAQGPLWALGRPAESHLGRDRPEVADGVQVEPGRCLARDHDPVPVLRRRRSENREAARRHRAHQRAMGRALVRRCRSIPRDELERTPRVLRNELDQSLLERRLDELSRAEVELELDAVAGRPQSLPVELGEQDALGEVERCDGDRIVVEGGRPRSGG